MNIVRVKYERLFPIGMYLNEKIGFEAEIGTTIITSLTVDEKKYWEDIGQYPVKLETPQEVVEQLRQLAENIHKEKYPHFYIEQEGKTFGSGKSMTDILVNGTKEELEQFADANPVKYHSQITSDEQSQGLIEVINTCDTIQKLERFEKQVERNGSDEAYQAYQRKYTQLTKP